MPSTSTPFKQRMKLTVQGEQNNHSDSSDMHYNEIPGWTQIWGALSNSIIINEPMLEISTEEYNT